MKKEYNKIELLEEYRQISTGNISDAMDDLGLPCGVVSSGPKSISSAFPVMAGYACTIQQMPKHQLSHGRAATKQLQVFNETAQPGEVVVIDVEQREDVCSCGGLLALRAKMRGVAGIVVNGCCRDIDELIKEQLPIFCTGVSPRKSIPLETTGVNIPVSIGGVQIRPGDLIVGDTTGLVVVPVEYAQKILEKAKFICAVEEKMEKMVRAGEDYSGLRSRAEKLVLQSGC